MKKRIFTFTLIFILCFTNVSNVYADAGSIVVAGGSVITVASGAIAGPAVVAVFCALMAFGMNVELSQASQNAGMTKTQFLKTKIEQYCTEARISYDAFNSYVLSQADILQNGAISVTAQASKTIQRFCNWLFEYDQVSDPNVAVSGIVVDGVTYPYIEAGSSGVICSFTNTDNTSREVVYVYNNGDYPVSALIHKSSNAYFVDIVGLQPFENVNIQTKLINVSADRVESDNTITSYSSNRGALYISTVIGLSFDSLQNESITTSLPIYDGTLTDFANAITGVGQDVDKITGDQTTYDTSKDVLNPTQDKTVIITPNINIPVPQDKDITINVNEYLEKVQELIDGAVDNIVTVIDDATGVPINIEWDPTQDWDPTIEKENDTDLPPDDEKTPIIDKGVLPDLELEIDPLTIDLKGVFPFCIPYDFKDMLGLLNSSPVAPSYTVNWNIPIVNENLSFTVDLSPFNGVASVMRTMELLAFCVALAVVTRSMFIRG